MGKLIKKIIETENLHWAWKKVKNSFQVGDIWYDEIELSSFEANLYDNLEKIKQDIKSEIFTLFPIKPLPFPKGIDKEKGIPRVRQTFDINIRDQVIWMAVVNVIGESLDYKMPWWSYGHRLYVPVWKDNMNDSWDIGWYRHSKGHLYRKWNQSWPLFRRNISLTAKIMCHKKSASETVTNNIELDEVEQNVYDNNKTLPNHFKSQYLQEDYWKAELTKKLYWGTVDFSKFYPKVKRNVIVENIFKYTVGANEDIEFKSLVANLVDFKVDALGWSQDDLSKEAGIDLDPQNFQGLPTGLFVAGFLANVALLDVDSKITEKLNENRDIAHFRFVDDHVILAYDFEKLQEWINIYKKYLEEANTGAEFNFEKIEPKSLSNILNPEWFEGRTEGELETERKNAEKDATLDPAFPAPLMTQTLAKVSAINNSDFEFLSHNEEEQLISDLEHLLLTDFPDHELRKDTRVSFAASVLSRIVPNTKDDYTDVYECQKKIHHKIKDYQKKYRRSDIKFISNQLHNLIFNNPENIQEYFSTWKEEVKLSEESDIEKTAIDDIKKEKEREMSLMATIDGRKNRQKNRVYKLLNKAISENPEKVRIWTRVIDYCKKVGCCHVKEAYDKIEELTGYSVHPLSASFLRTLFMNVLADRTMQVIYAIANKKLLSKKEKNFAAYFINTVFDEKFLDDLLDKSRAETKIYYVKTYEYYRFVLGSAIFILQETDFRIKNGQTLIDKFRLIDWRKNPKDWVTQTHSTNINAWLYWLLWKTHDKSTSHPLDFWKKLQPYIDYENSTYKPLILPFPNYEHLPQQYDEFLKFIINAEFEEGWLFEIFKTKREDISNEVKETIKVKYQNLYNNLYQPTESLWDFIQLQQNELNNLPQKEIDAFNKYFDPHFSEWTALELVKQITEQSKETAEDFFSGGRKNTQYHPANFIISNTLIDKPEKVPSWYEWKDKMRTKPILDIIELNSQISDKRYTTKGLLYSEQKLGEQAKVHALGIILLQLLTHDTSFPWIWNSADKSLMWENLIYRKIQGTPISSYTLLILQSCFSSKNRETFNNNEVFHKFSHENNGGKNDTFMDAPLIPDVHTLMSYIEKSQKIIESYQLSMENNAPRQLIPISLIQLSNQNNPFEDSDNI